MYINYIKHNKRLPDYETIMNNLHSYAIPNTPGVQINTWQTNENDLDMLAEKYKLNEKLPQLIQLGEISRTIPKTYQSFRIPKHSGGFRRIDAPNAQLNNHLKNVKNYFERDLKVLPHNAAYAYVKHRNCKDAIQVHQKNQSKWFLKLDMKSFFNNCSKDFIYSSLISLFQFTFLTRSSEGRQALKHIINSAMLNGGLPQGTSLSPMLTNLAMIPIDYEITNTLAEINSDIVYTRYADDILISSKYKFDMQKIISVVEQIIRKHSPLRLNKAKTRFGSSAGRNWNLGLMLNKDNNITVGYRAKELYRAKLFQYCSALTKNENLDNLNVSELAGITSYYCSIEPDYFNRVIEKYTKKFNIDINKLF